ncbi:MAG: HPr kinase/phosphatase C-terminal domain-containing protein [Alphaproteobacteria bacterium]
MTGADAAPVHATCVAIDGAGVLIRGASGAGKSDLALRLIDGGAALVADDQVALETREGELWVRAPARLRGRLEVRGVGIVDLPSVEAARLVLVVDLVATDTIERLPEAACETILGTVLPRLRIAPFESSAPAKLRLAARQATRDSKPRS